MAENLAKKPAKGILKTSTSFEKCDSQKPSKFKETKWDEMNILATLHPPDKDYGHMKIEEPKTPYNWVKEEHDELDANLLAEKIQLGVATPPKYMHAEAAEEIEVDEEEDDSFRTPEDQERRKTFESKRKLHYNEFQAVKLARKLMEQDEDDVDEESASGSTASASAAIDDESDSDKMIID